MKKPISFNPFQKVVIDFRTGYAVCMAAPGSGKTAVIVARIKAMMAEGIHPSEILSLTFTKEGAKEMTERAGIKDVEEKIFSTFHSWALAFIKTEWKALPFKVKTDWHGNPAPLCLPLDAARTMAQICRRIPDIKWKDAASYASLMKRRGISPQMAMQHVENEKEELYAVAYQKYEHSLRDKGVLDFDSVVIETASLLEKRADVRARNQFRFVQVDEAQDTDSVQWRIVKAVSEKHQNALAVGDENQGMYSWRGSESNLTSYFCQQFPSAKVFPLPINYRSTGSIVQYCKEIAPIQNDTVTRLSTPNERGVEPVFRLYPREDEEATAVINGCTDLGNTAILARTNRQLAAFENECGNRNLRYKLLGKSGFWGQHEVKDALAIVGSVAMPTDSNILRMLSSRCEATKFLRKADTRDADGMPTALKKFQQYNGSDVPINKLITRFSCGDSSQDDIVRGIGHIMHGLRSETMTMGGKAAMQRVLDKFGVLSSYDEVDDDEKNFDNDPRDNILKLVEYAEKQGGLGKFYEWTLRVQRALRARTNCLTLSTIHQSKGKEWENVYVVGVNDEVLPHIKGEESEEARIYFVACSRAAKRLEVSANGVPSKFIKEKLPKTEPNGAPIVDLWEGFQLRMQ